MDLIDKKTPCRLSPCLRNTILRHWYVVKASQNRHDPFFWMVHSLLVFDSGSNLPPTRCRWSQHDPALGRKNILWTLLLSCCVLVCLCVRGQQHRRMSFKMFSGLYSTQSLFERNKYISVVTERTFYFWLLVGWYMKCLSICWSFLNGLLFATDAVLCI